MEERFDVGSFWCWGVFYSHTIMLKSLHVIIYRPINMIVSIPILIKINMKCKLEKIENKSNNRIENET